ncbi:hypothetical protein CEY12_07800 [Chryseobacterium sp. T16E-39]|uniref:hypothetical protein n=1 Tax=Chryseobacterium sp. T16E-39 TaxID=2015076 RepID=UPI000B5B2464|nr:hypothetical protein [Chryseobacterium sp. T16E-39]ASK30017.1 hypothetical protein CEY12_07800 [Chryseobacterium sp. T16E-39]
MRVNGKHYNIGMSKQEVLEDNGIGENSYSANTWYYIIRKKFLAGKEVLFIEFEEGVAVHFYIRYVYRNIKNSLQGKL